MWFDPYAKLAEIAEAPPATSATTATQTPPARDKSQAKEPDTKASGGFWAKADVAIVADVASLKPQKTETAPDAVLSENRYPHAYSALGNPVTWTGRIVSLDDWRGLSQWERHGPDGRHWNGITQRWELPE